MDRQRLLAALGGSLWILGLILSIIGLNISGGTGRWMSVIGNISFLVGLGLEGVWWFRGRKEKNQETEKESSGADRK